jgi:hypothetical protein
MDDALPVQPRKIAGLVDTLEILLSCSHRVMDRDTSRYLRCNRTEAIVTFDVARAVVVFKDRPGDKGRFHRKTQLVIVIVDHQLIWKMKIMDRAGTHA